MSAAAERPVEPELPPSWARLERAVREASAALTAWRRRALEAEEESARLRRALEELATQQDRPADSAGAEIAEELLRLRAENVALRSRMAQARRKVASLLKRMAALETRE